MPSGPPPLGRGGPRFGAVAGILPLVNVSEVPKWVMPWMPPTGMVTQEALRALDRPLLAWPSGEFDAEEYYAGFPGQRDQRPGTCSPQARHAPGVADGAHVVPG